MSGHTAGPWWRESEHALVVKANSEATDWQVVCQVGTGLKTQSEVAANANLIAAAPDLLEALQELHEAETVMFPAAECGQQAQTDWAKRKALAHERAVAAIAKATGSAA